MPLVRKLSSTANVIGCLGLAALLVALAGWKLHEAQVEANTAAARVERTEQVLIAIGRFRASVRNIVAADRGFVLSRDPVFLGDRETAEQQARSTLASLRSLVAAEPDASAQVADLAARFEARLAASHAEPAGPTAFGSVLPEARRATLDALSLANTIEQRSQAQLAQRHRENAERQHAELLTVALSFDIFAVVTLLTGTGLYIESRRRRRSEKQLSEIVENLPLTVWQAITRGPHDRRFVYVGSNARRDRGLAASSVLCDPDAVLQTVHEEDRPALLQALDAGGPSLDHTFRVQAGDKVRWIHARASAQAVDEGSLWTGYWADVTQQKELEQSLREASKAAQSASVAKSAFLAVMSHEIRTPLNGMLGLLELLDLTQLSDEQRATLGVVRDSGRSLSQIIDDILDLTRVEAGRMELHPVAASLPDVVLRASQVHRGVALSKGLHLDWWVDPRLAPAHLFDPLRVGQILNNFISNALKFTSRGGVRVSAELLSQEGGMQRVRLSVTDTGIGVSSETLARIFEPFVQAEADTAARYGGSGLGLAICRQLARAMGGDIQMHSTLGVGSRIVLEADFALAAPPPPAARDATPPRLASALAARTAVPIDEAERQGSLVLVVDDHPTNRLVLARQVAALGYTAITAESGPAALQIWSSRRIGLVLCDCYMPGWTGFDLARAIREREEATPGVRVPIVACTASVSAGERQRCTAAGMDACLTKPVELLGLMEELEAFLPLPDAATRPAIASLSPEPGVLVEFERSHAADLRELERAVGARDFAQARFLAHRMAGAALAIGAASLSSCCRALEQGARLEDAACMEVDLDELREQTERFARELGEQRDSVK